MATKDCTEISTEEFDNWLSELFAVTEAMEYVLDLIPDEHAVLSNVLALFQRRMSELLIEGHDHWNNNSMTLPIRRLTGGEYRRPVS